MNEKALYSANAVLFLSLNALAVIRPFAEFSLFVVIWSVASLGSVALGGRFFGHYFLQAELPLSLLAGCMSHALPEPNQASLARSQASDPTATLSDLQFGRTVYQHKCSACHLPIAPMRFGVREWPRYVQEMKGRAGLSPLEAKRVEQYVLATTDH